MVGRVKSKRGVQSIGKAPGVSDKSLTIARIVDRLCRTPGQYQITITIPSHKRGEWTIIFNRLEKLREVDIKR